MNKFGRNYELSVQTQEGNTIVVKPPFTVEFDITRKTLSSANTSTIRVYNLSKKHRNQIRKNINDLGDYRSVSFKAGYGNNLSLAFLGNITHAWNVREGTNFITQIESFDGGFAYANGFTQQNFPAGTARAGVMAALQKNLAAQNVAVGAIGKVDGTLSRGIALNGSTTNLLKELSGGTFFIDNQKSYVLGDNECLPSRTVPVINAKSGLLGTPLLEQTILHFDMIFEPGLLVGQLVHLDNINPVVPNGDYKVVALKHRGMISDAVCGTAITTVELFAPLAGTGLTIVGSL